MDAPTKGNAKYTRSVDVSFENRIQLPYSTTEISHKGREGAKFWGPKTGKIKITIPYAHNNENPAEKKKPYDHAVPWKSIFSEGPIK